MAYEDLQKHIILIAASRLIIVNLKGKNVEAQGTDTRHTLTTTFNHKSCINTSGQGFKKEPSRYQWYL